MNECVMCRSDGHWLCRLRGHKWAEESGGYVRKFNPPICVRCGYDPNFCREQMRRREDR